MVPALVVAVGATFYVDAVAGRDDRDGRSPDAAWMTLERAGREPYPAGSALMLAGGQTHVGPLRLQGGTPGAAPGLRIASYGEGRAVVDGGAGDGIAVTGLEKVTIERLTVRGAGRKTGNTGGSGVLLDRVHGGMVNDLDASGFQHAGVAVRDGEDIRLTAIHAHDNGFTGIQVRAAKVYVGHCRAINNPGDPTIRDNHSGNGILLGGCREALVEYCEAAGNGWDQPRGGQPNGPVGIWCHDSERVTIQHCISHHNKSTSGDGGGFDFDGGTRDSVLQYNYSYENHSSGYLVWEYGSRDPIARNVIRYNISVNDREGGFRVGKSGGQDITDLEVHHNTFINDRFPCVDLVGSWEAGGLKPDKGIVRTTIRDNILIGPARGAVVKGTAPVRFERNLYWSFDGTYAVNGKTRPADGELADPRLVDFRLVPQLVDPDRLGDLTAFTFAKDAPFTGKVGHTARDR